MGRHVRHFERRIGLARSVEQGKPGERNLGSMSGQLCKHLPAGQLAARHQRKTAKLGAFAKRDDLAFKIEIGRVAERDHVVDRGAGGDFEPGQPVALRAGAGADQPLDQEAAGIGAKHEAEMSRGRKAGAGDVDDLDLAEIGAVLDFKREAAGRERAAERQHGIVGRRRPRDWASPRRAWRRRATRRRVRPRSGRRAPPTARRRDAAPLRAAPAPQRSARRSAQAPSGATDVSVERRSV